MELKALDVCYKSIEIILSLVSIFNFNHNVEVGRLPTMSKIVGKVHHLRVRSNPIIGARRLSFLVQYVYM